MNSDRNVPRALVFDIDGTILNSKGTMTKTTYKTLRACAEKGLLVTFATARSGRIVFRKEEIPWDRDFLIARGIYYNGGTVYDHPKDFYQHTAIPGPLVQRAVAFVSDYDDALQVALQHDDVYHGFKFPMSDQELQTWGFRRDEIMDFEQARQKPTTKVMIFGGTNFHGITQDLSDLHVLMKDAFGTSLDIILADSRKSIYLLSRHVNKGNAIKMLIGLNDIKAEEVAVFGDDTPDIGMFGVFGHSIAMGNAHGALKQKATFVTRSNDEEGILFALREYLKII